MSMVMRLSRPQLSPVQRPPITPPAGPESRSPIGRSREFSSVEMPPFDCMMRTFALTPSCRSRASRLFEIGGGLRADIGVHRRAREALIFADGVDDLRRAGDEGVGQDRS